MTMESATKLTYVATCIKKVTNEPIRSKDAILIDAKSVKHYASFIICTNSLDS